MEKLEHFMKYLLDNGAKIDGTKFTIKNINLTNFYENSMQVFGCNILKDFNTCSFYFVARNGSMEKVYINLDGRVEEISTLSTSGSEISRIKIFYDKKGNPSKYFEFSANSYNKNHVERFKFKWSDTGYITEIEIDSKGEVRTKTLKGFRKKDKISFGNYIRKQINSGTLNVKDIIKRT